MDPCFPPAIKRKCFYLINLYWQDFHTCCFHRKKDFFCIHLPSYCLSFFGINFIARTGKNLYLYFYFPSFIFMFTPLGMPVAAGWTCLMASVSYYRLSPWPIWLCRNALSRFVADSHKRAVLCSWHFPLPSRLSVACKSTNPTNRGRPSMKFLPLHCKATFPCHFQIRHPSPSGGGGWEDPQRLSVS